MHLDQSSANSTSGFGNAVTANAQSILIGEESKAKANLVSVDDMKYSVVIPQFSYVAPSGTSLTIRMKGSNTSVTDGVFTVMNSDIETFFSDRERTIRSRSNELQAGGQKSIEVSIPLATVSTKISPFIDDIKSDMVAIENIISPLANSINESYPSGGSTAAKYVSKRVVLAEGQDAEDLVVYLSAYKPSNTNIEVYAKLLNGDDSEGIETKWWTPLSQNTSSAVVSSRIDRNDFREFSYELPSRFSINAASNAALADYSIYGSFSAANGISANTLSAGNTTPLPIGSLVYFLGTNANGLSNGFYSILTANTTAVKLAVAGAGTEVAVTNTDITNSDLNLIYTVPQTAFKDKANSNIVSYYTNTGAHLHSYKTFSIKIVMSSEEGSHIVPRVSDMRAIALQA
jgi:hypothetical protein